jgi:hypothetical protein
MSSDAFVLLLNQDALDQYVFLAIGFLVIVGVGLLVRRKFRTIEVRLDEFRQEVNRLKEMEERRFLVALPSALAREANLSKAEQRNPSIAPEIADDSAGNDETQLRRSARPIPVQGRGDR